MKYNFGEIHTAFVNNFKKLNETKEGRKTIKQYIEIVKNNETLIKEHQIFEEIPSYEFSTPEQASVIIIEAIKKSNNKNISKENDKLVKLLEGLNIEIENLDNEYYNSVNLLLTIDNPLKNVDKICESEQAIKKHLVEKCMFNENKYDTNGLTLDELANFMLLKFNNKYSEKLNEDEKKLFKQLTEAKTDDEKKLIFEEYKKDCLKLINEGLKTKDIDVKEKLLSIKERVLSEEFKNDEFETKINEYIELTNILSE